MPAVGASRQGSREISVAAFAGTDCSVLRTTTFPMTAFHERACDRFLVDWRGSRMRRVAGSGAWTEGWEAASRRGSAARVSRKTSIWKKCRSRRKPWV